MVRSLYTGVSGLRNHQVKMDVTSHNISNVNTVGYKSQRVTLKEGFTQMLRGAARPAGNAGGTNPMQLGLGMSVGSIDSIMEQGGLQTTGKLTDLAIEGNAFFAYSNGNGGTFYGRSGAMQLNSDGVLVSPTNGYYLLGLTADANGNIPHDATAGAIRIPFGDKSPAKATEEISFSCNLDSDSHGLGTWTHTATFLTNAHYDNTATSNSDYLTSLYDENGNSLGIQDKDKLKITFKRAGEEQTMEFTVDTSTSDANYQAPAKGPTANPPTVRTMEELARAIERALNADADGVDQGYGITVTYDTYGRLNIIGAATSDTNLVVNNTTRPNSNSYVANTFQWIGSLAPQGIADVAQVGKVLAPVREETSLGATYDAHGVSLGFNDGPPLSQDPITVGATIGNTSIAEDDSFKYGWTWNDAQGDWEYGGEGATTIKDLMIYLQHRLRLPDQVSTPEGSTISSVQINTIDSGDTRAPVGSIVIRGQAGEAFAITGLSVRAETADGRADAPSNFNANMIGTTFQTARDTTIQGTSIDIYDDKGAAHTVVMTLTHAGTPGKWLWELTTSDGELIIGGNRGTLTFAEDGSPTAWTFDDGSSEFRFNPMNGASNLSISLNTGEFGSFTGITQFRSATTTTAKGQDGYPMGKLSEITITETGMIQGLFTNGTTRDIAVILLAEFHNSAGLYRAGDTMWTESNNSGEGVLYRPGEGTSSTIKPGALEMSNVDLASEFTDLITTQRGYQASARVITTSDELLQELINLKR